MAAPQVIRPLSHLEKYKSSLHLLRQHCGTAVACRYVFPKGLTIDAVQTILHRAVARTVLQHPLMQAGLHGEDSASPFWVQLESIDFDKHIVWQTVPLPQDIDVVLRDTVQRQIHTWFDNLESQPGWRLSVLAKEGCPSIDVVFCWHHAYFDGMSAKIFHQTLLRNLDGPNDEEEPANLINGTLSLQASAGRFPPPVEKLRKIPVSLGFTVSTAWKELKPPFLATYNESHANWAPICEKPYGTESHMICIDAETVRRAIALCRQHETTLTGLLNALVLVSLTRQLDEANEFGLKKTDALSSVTALDLRRFMPSKTDKYPWHDPQRTMDNEVSLIEHAFDKSLLADIRTRSEGAKSPIEVMGKVESIVWSVAARMRHEIQHKIDSDMANDPVGLMDYVKDWRDQMRSKVQKPRTYTWGLTNLGVFDGRDQEGTGSSWRIEKAWFRLSAEVAAPAFHISVVSVKGGDLCMDIGWQTGILDNAIGQALASDVKGCLKCLEKLEH